MKSIADWINNFPNWLFAGVPSLAWSFMTSEQQSAVPKPSSTDMVIDVVKLLITVTGIIVLVQMIRGKFKISQLKFWK